MNIVITGGSKGIGKAIAVKFASEKNNIFLCSRNKPALSATADELNKNGIGIVKPFAADLTDKEAILRFSDWILSQCESVDVLVNNAGDFIPGSVHNEEDGTLEKMLSVNLLSAYHLTRAFLPSMMQKKSGHIFNMSSIAALSAYNNGGSYSISKFALTGFSKNLREEMKPFDIKVTTIYPGAVYTDSWKDSGVKPERIMEANDIADMVYAATLLSPQACVEDIVIRPLKGDLP
ncbi:MAG TPA: SDR family oxidoreductase [Hanamia sp.]